jgi:hypothetical protein
MGGGNLRNVGLMKSLKDQFPQDRWTMPLLNVNNLGKKLPPKFKNVLLLLVY